MSPRRVATWLARFVDAARVRQVDVVGTGWGGLVGRAFAAGWPSRVRALVTVDAPGERLEGELLARWREAHSDPAALRHRLGAALPACLSEQAQRELRFALEIAPDDLLQRVYLDLPVRRSAGEAPALLAAPVPQPCLDASDSWADMASRPESLRDALASLAAEVR